MGLLDNTQQPQQQMGGLLGGQPQAMPPQGMPPQGAPPPQGMQGQDNSQKMIAISVGNELLSNPSKNGVMKAIEMLKNSGSLDAQKVAQSLMQVADNPDQIKNLAQMILQKAQNA